MATKARDYVLLDAKPHHTTGEPYYVEVQPYLEEPNFYELCEIILYNEDDETFLVHCDYMMPQEFTDGLPSEEDHWLGAVPVIRCRDVLTKEEAKVRYPRNFLA